MEDSILISVPGFSQLSFRKKGSGPVLLLLHGFPEDGRLWDEVAPQLQENFTVIVPDLPGSGGSALPDSTLTVEKMAEAILAILKHEGISQAVIAGHSMGGYAALAFADRYPEMLKGLSLVHSTGTADTEEKKEQRRKSAALIRKEGGKEAFVKQMVPGLFASLFQQRYPAAVGKQIDRANEQNAESLASFQEAMALRPDRTHVIKESKVPVGWMLGKDDTTIPLEKVIGQVSQSETSFLHIYTDCGHMAMLEAPQKLSKDLLNFAAYCYNR